MRLSVHIDKERKSDVEYIEVIISYMMRAYRRSVGCELKAFKDGDFAIVHVSRVYNSSQGPRSLEISRQIEVPQLSWSACHYLSHRPQMSSLG